MSDDLTRLREIAAAATPGEWGWRHFGDDPENDCRIVNYDVEPWRVVADEIWQPADAEFIATFDPPTVTALIDRAERAERERDAARSELAALRAAVTGLADEIAAASPEPFAPFHFFYGSKLRALLTDEGDNQ